MTITSSSAVQRTFEYCECPSNTLPLSTIQSGYFPGSPVIPQVAFHFDILSLYLALNVSSSTPIASFHAALFGILQENGYGFPVNEFFLGPFSEAVTWFKALWDVVEVETEREFLLPTGPAELDAPLCLDTLHKSVGLTMMDLLMMAIQRSYLMA
ncbi:uncharacterized protein EI90DRAFT_3128580 [Cantharellus anzutake]|uniref:uncharacterized protein n=1 Tax=Cantharellus anzutake TaxID=1750568 RepID=UPI001907067F|nr:uncharacterized protein EI90DRAFT_3128580 [Cantharellus anzutake]KAF8325669.1 hypothetical protein EI90DRAFT_3128580 [Cantharellus anzutake]